jgi:hypothetical protein
MQALPGPTALLQSDAMQRESAVISTGMALP